MKKGLFLSMLAAVGLLFSTSCSSDEQLLPDGDGMLTVNLSFEGNYSTRANKISDGNTVNWYKYFVCSPDGQTTYFSGERSLDPYPIRDALRINLVKGQAYKIIFFGYNKDAGIYTVNDDKTVTINYENMKNNDEARDAFCQNVDIESFAGTGSIDVVLRRPLAQLNVGVTKKDWDAAVQSGKKFTKSSVTVKQVASTLNLISGAVSNPVDVTFDFASNPTDVQEGATEEMLLVDLNGNGSIDEDNVNTAEDESEMFHWLSMCYVLPYDESATGTERMVLDETSFVFKAEDGTDFHFSEGLTNVPLQRNYRTNIVGKILTGQATFNITVDGSYFDDHNVVRTAQELKDAIKNGMPVVLANDLDLGESYTIGSTSDSLDKYIDLNGHTLTAYGIYLHGGELSQPKITIKNGTLKLNTYTTAGGTYKEANYIELYNGTINLENVTAECGGLLLISPYATQNTALNIKNSTIIAPACAIHTTSAVKGKPLNNTGAITVNLENSTFNGGETGMVMGVGATVTATGCTFQGAWQAAFMHCGTFSFSNCKFNLALNGTEPSSGTTWGDSNNSVLGALVIGNNLGANENSESYGFDAIVNLIEGNTFTINGDNANDVPAIFLSGRNSFDTKLTYSSDDAFKNVGKGLQYGVKTRLFVNGAQVQ